MLFIDMDYHRSLVITLDFDSDERFDIVVETTLVDIKVYNTVTKQREWVSWNS